MSELTNSESLEHTLVEGVPILEISPENARFPVVPSQLQIGELPVFGVVIVAILVVFGVVGGTFMLRCYKVPQASEAYVITGVGCKDGYRVIMGGGTIIMPVLNQVTRVPLTQFEIPAEVELFTEDPLKVKVQAKVYVKVNGVKESIIKAAQGLGNGKEVTPKAVHNRAYEQGIDAIRSAGQNLQFNQIRANKKKFSEQVRDLMEHDLSEFGLTLLDVAVTDVIQIPVTDAESTGSVLSAAALKIQTRQIEAAEVEKAQVRKEARLRTLQIEEEEAEATQAQRQRVQSLEAETNRQISIKQITEEEATQKARLQQESAIQEAEAEKLRASQVAAIQSQTAIEEANSRKAIQVALARQQQRTAEEESAIAIAEAEKLRQEAEAERIKAQQNTLTVEQLAEADRTKRLAEIAAEQLAQEEAIRQIKAAEIEKESRVLAGEAALKAAELEADALKAKTQAQLEAGQAEAAVIKLKADAENALDPKVRDYLLRLQLVEEIAPKLETLLPRALQALKPTEAVYKDATIMVGGGSNGNSVDELMKLQVANSGAAVLNALAEAFQKGEISNLVSSVISNGNSKDTPDE
ncbi:MAG: flotillin domain-containing protein [Leptolyngbyaceae cyanobacterium MO_188.B28]|nr:flotillin domain-containing protein [Leptolyngbyaceae cyanobacterium MO_188.B28]